jgi:histidinol dehydrogenase
VTSGGAQAIAALALGTESVPKVDKIFGPGNQYVTMAKQLVSVDLVAIDMPAGPSEVLVIADEHADPDLVAADLLSQAEHGSDSQAILLTTSERIAQEVQSQVGIQLDRLPRRMLAVQSLAHSAIIVLEDLERAFETSNRYAPEHLIVHVRDPERYVPLIRNAGSVFIGPWTPESAGDYASGTNHTLPTSGWAAAYSGVSLDSYLKKITFQRISAPGLERLGPTIQVMAAAEGLDAHKEAVTLRLHKIADDKESGRS